MVLRVAQEKYIAGHYKTKLGKLASELPFADNYLFSSESKENLLKAMVELINLHQEFGSPLKEPSHNLGPGFEYLGSPYSPNSNTLCLRCNTLN